MNPNEFKLCLKLCSHIHVFLKIKYFDLQTGSYASLCNTFMLYTHTYKEKCETSKEFSLYF